MQGCASSASLPGEGEPAGQDPTGGGAPSSTASSGGTVAGTSSQGVGGAPSTGGGAPAASTGGSVGSVGSATGGARSAANGAAGASSSAAGSASTVPATSFGQVTALLDKRCAGMKCHGSGATQLAFAATTGTTLHSLLTTPMASSVPHCAGVTLVAPNDANSPLLKIVASGGKIACTKPKSESVGPMPEKCTTTSTSATGKCLTADEIKTLSDWIAAGAPLN